MEPPVRQDRDRERDLGFGGLGPRLTVLDRSSKGRSRRRRTAGSASVPSHAVMPQVTPGRELGVYQIISPLGEGAMGVVFRARDRRLGRDVALKILHPDLVASPRTLDRFKMEAYAASVLNHPNIVTIYEIGEVDGVHFIAMEYVEGVDLRGMLRRGPPTLRTVVRIMAGIVDGLAAAHAKGIIHRDLKPDNVMLSQDGFVKILDFGLAKPFQGDCDPSDDEQTLRRPGEGSEHGLVLGTPGYMSPEQVAGDRVDHRSDQFSFGSLVFEMLAHRRPFERATCVETMTAILREPAPRLRQVAPSTPPAIDRIVTRCLSKKVQDRYATTAELAHEVHEVRDALAPGSGAMPRPVSPAPPRVRARMLMVAAVIVVLAGVLFTAHNDVPMSASLESGSLQASPLPSVMYLAIVPFASNEDPESDLWAGGVSETIASRLAGLPGIQIISPSAARDVDGSLRAIARELGANLILRVSVRHVAEDLRINYTLILPETGVQVAAGTVNGATNNLFVLEDRLSDRILHDLRIELADGRELPSNRDLLDDEAQKSYLLALGALQRYENEDSVDFAIDRLESLYEAAPDSALVGAALGRAYLYKFQITRAPEWSGRAIEISEALLDSEPELPEVHSTYGEVLTLLGRYEDAILQFRRALAVRPDFAEATLGMAEAMDKAGRDDEARAAYVEAIQLRPAFAGNHIKLGSFHYRRGQIVQAEQQYRRAVDLTPDNTRALNNLGVILMNRGLFPESATMFRRSLKVGETAPGWSNLGTSLYYGGEYQEAASAFARATTLAPDNYTFWMNLGDACRWSPEADRTRMVQAYERAIELAGVELDRDPENAFVHVALGSLYAKTGKAELARRHTRRALAQLPDDPDILLFSAITMHILNDDEAIELLSRAAASGIDMKVLDREPELVRLRSSDEWKRIGARRETRSSDAT